jgi:hypothetical protein
MAPEVVRARGHILRFRGSAALLVRLWFVAGVCGRLCCFA